MAKKHPHKRWFGQGDVRNEGTKIGFNPDATWNIQIAGDGETAQEMVGMSVDEVRQLVLYSASRTRARHKRNTVSSYSGGSLVVQLDHVKYQAVVARREVYEEAGVALPEHRPQVIQGQEACAAFLNNLARTWAQSEPDRGGINN